jgi:alpha-tubulin suppressor-like RCC1 family protein
MSEQRSARVRERLLRMEHVAHCGENSTHKKRANAYRSDQTAVCWGSNRKGKLGNNSTTNSPAPVAVLGLTDAVQIALGADYYSCARRSSGQVVCWGDNVYGQLGVTVIADSPVPVAVPGISDAVDLGLGAAHSCVRRASGQVVCWGNNSEGQLGTGSSDASSSTPSPVSNLSDGAAIALGGTFSCAVRTYGAVACWGSGGIGTLGNDATDASRVPVTATGLTDAVDIALGSVHACALKRSGHIACWGYNGSGQLGYVTLPRSESPTPLDVGPPAP